MTDNTSWWAEGVGLNLSDYIAPPKKLKLGGGQDGGDAAATRASCLPFLFSLQIMSDNVVIVLPLSQ